MSWLTKKIFGTKKKNETNQSFRPSKNNDTGLPSDWHINLFVRPGGPYVAKELFSSGIYLNQLDEHKQLLEDLYNNWKSGTRKSKKESFGKKQLSLHESKINQIKKYVDMNFGSPDEKNSNNNNGTDLLSNTAQDFKYAIKTAKADIYDYGKYMKIKQNNYISALLNDTARVWEWYYNNEGDEREMRLPSPPKQRTPQIKTFISKGPPPKRKPPPRKSSVAKKLSDQLGFDNIQKEFQPDPNAQQGFLNTNKLPPITPPNEPLNEKDNDWDTFFRKFSDDYKKRYGDITPMTEKDLIEFLRREGLTDKEIENMKINHPDFFNLVLKKGDHFTKQAYVDGYKSKFIDNPKFGGRKRRKRKSRKRKSNKKKRRRTRRKYKNKTPKKSLKKARKK